jgi:hypothetical protein
MPRPKPLVPNTLFSLRLDNDLKEHLEILAWLRRDSITGLLEKGARDYIKNNPLTDAEFQMLTETFKKYPDKHLQLLQGKNNEPLILATSPLKLDKKATAKLKKSKK